MSDIFMKESERVKRLELLFQYYQAGRIATLQRVNRMLRVGLYVALAAWAVLVCLWLGSPPAFSQSEMFSPYEVKGYAGPVGSDVTGDPLVLQTVFQGRDAYGARVEVVAPVEVDAVSLDAAINYVTFTPNTVDTEYFREVFRNYGVVDLDGDGSFSELTAVDGLPDGTDLFQCDLRPASGTGSSPVAADDVRECLAKGAGYLDAVGALSLSYVMTDVSSPTGPNVDRCEIRLEWTATGPVLGSVSYSKVRAFAHFHTGSTVNSAADCGSPSISAVIEPYDGEALISVVEPTFRNVIIGDTLAAIAFTDEYMPVELLDAAMEFTEALEDEEGDYFECPDCLYENAYGQTPVYWREGYSFAPFGLGQSQEGGGGSGDGFSCEEGSLNLACLEVDPEGLEPVSEGELEGAVIDPFEGTTFEGFIEDAAFQGFDETRECPEPFEIERTGIFGDGVIEVPVEQLCTVATNYVNPMLHVLAWLCAGLILFKQ